MTERNSYIRVTSSEKETIVDCIEKELNAEPGTVATGWAVSYLCEKAVDGE